MSSKISKMASNPADHRNLLQPEESDLSETSTAIASPPEPSSIFQRHGYHRMGSQDLTDLTDPSPRYQSPVNPPSDERDIQGLGISHAPTRSIGSIESITRKPLAIKASPSPPTPSNPHFVASIAPEIRTPNTQHSATSSRSPLSPAWQRYETAQTRGEGLRAVTEVDEELQSLNKGKMTSSFTEDLLNTPDDFNNETQSFSRVSMNGDNDTTRLLNGCPSHHNIQSHRTSWLSMSILFLSIYSTILSCIYLIIALVAPRYGHTISSKGGRLSLSTASTLFALFAKTIELSFVTVFVAFLGQVLSRRSLMKSTRGVTISEMTMRSWVIQPGSMITHWENLRYAGASLLGAITLVAAFVAMFYTTASDALVSPKLKFGRLESREIIGMVKMSYANPGVVAADCQTPISITTDQIYEGTTCLQIQHAGQGYHNSIAFMATWSKIAKGVGTSSNIMERPAAPAMMFDNTTVAGSWVYPEYSNVTASYAKYDRVVNNISLSMPHAGVFAAARVQDNGILQPDDLGGFGQYVLHASVASPSVNIICANADEDELAPLIYAKFPNSNMTQFTPTDEYTAPKGWNFLATSDKKYFNSTKLDDIFQWGEAYDRKPPIFPMYPAEFNSLVNASMAWGSDAYLLIKAPNTTTTNYTMCQMRSFLSPDCSTVYNVSSSSAGHLHSICNDPGDKYMYRNGAPDARIGNAQDWLNIASEWMNALTLNNGIKNANASNARLLSQLVIAESPSGGTAQLNPLQPSIAEQLSVLAGSTLLLSSTGASYKHYWNYTNTLLETPIAMPFNASIISQQYASGYSQNWEASFYIVLFLVFATNVFCLIFLFVYAGLVTDFTEQQNLFALAVNSPPARRLSGSCGAGPEGEQMKINWHVVQEDRTGHFYYRDGGAWISQQQHDVKVRQRRTLKSQSSYQKLSSKRTSWL